MENKITKRIKKAIQEQVFPGCVVGIVYKNGKRVMLSFGNFTYEKNSPTIKENSIFDVASITKSIPTSSLALRLIDEKKLNLEDKLIKFIPQINNAFREDILIKHLLTNTLSFLPRDGYPTLSSHKDQSPDEILNYIFNAPMAHKPGEVFNYNNATSILLGLVIGKVSGKTIDCLADEYFFTPLRMNRTTFHPEKFDKNKIVPTEIDEWRGRVIQGEIHDESAYTLSKKQVVGSAGLFSTAPDLLNFQQMLLNNRLLHLEGGSCLGWELYQPRYMGDYCSKNSFGKTGFTGCVIICDVEKGIGLTILSNYIYPKRKPDAKLINEIRKDIADIVFK